MFPNFDPQLLILLKGLLELNPHLRLTAKQALQSKVFDDFRTPDFENLSSKIISQKINECGAFDYDNLENNRYTIADYKKMLVREISFIKKS